MRGIHDPALYRKETQKQEHKALVCMPLKPAISRLFRGKPHFMDEATANVDPENEDRLQKAIEALTRDKTIIMIAHRLKTVRNADQILVVNGGEIVQQGRHEELIRQKGIYADFVLGREAAIGWKL